MNARRFITATVVAILAGQALAGGTATEVGNLQASGGGKVSLLVLELVGRKTGAMFVTDKHNIKTNMLALDRDQLLKLRTLIDATVAELDAQTAASSPTK